MTGYPWATGDELLAADLNAAIANSVAIGGGMLPLTGGTLTGPLTLYGNATQPLHAVPLQQMNSASVGGPFLPLAGGTLTGTLTAPQLILTGSLTLPSQSITATPNGTASLAISQTQAISDTLQGPVINCHANMQGSRSSGFLNWYSFAIDFDRVAVPGGATGVAISHAFGGGSPAVMTGGRTGFGIAMTMAGDTPSVGATSGGTGYFVASGPFLRADYWFGGIPGATKGSLFGENISVRAKTGGSIGSRGLNGANGLEVDVGIDFAAQSKNGITVVEWVDSKSDGWITSYAYSVALQGTGTAPGWDYAYSVGSPYGWWPLRATSTILGNYATVPWPGGPAAQAAVGIDFTGITLNKFGYKQDGAAIDGSGNVGGLTTFGATLQTRGSVQAKTAVLNTVSVVKGGEFLQFATLTVSPPPVSGTQAVAVVGSMSARRAYSIVGNQGTGYAAGNVLTVSGGTFTTAAQFTVRAVVAGTGAIIDLDATTPGSYSVLPSGFAALTGGAGTGAAVTVAWQIATVNVTVPGTNYPEFPPPLITSAGGKGAEPMFDVAMTASAAPMTLIASSVAVPLTNAANDAAAATANVPIGAIYRNGNAVQVRLV